MNLKEQRILNVMKSYLEAKTARRKRWVCKYNKDTCDFCKELHGKVVKAGDVFRIKGYELSGPPAHKGCNCTLEWIK